MTSLQKFQYDFEQCLGPAPKMHLATPLTGLQKQSMSESLHPHQTPYLTKKLA